MTDRKLIALSGEILNELTDELYPKGSPGRSGYLIESAILLGRLLPAIEKLYGGSPMSSPSELRDSIMYILTSETGLAQAAVAYTTEAILKEIDRAGFVHRQEITSQKRDDETVAEFQDRMSTPQETVAKSQA